MPNIFSIYITVFLTYALTTYVGKNIYNQIYVYMLEIMHKI